MSYRRKWSKEDFDNTFEAFLKTSLSSEDDTEKIKQLLDKPIEKKAIGTSSLWWSNDSDDESLKKDTTAAKGKSFLKTKKSESPVRSKTTTENGHGGKSFKSPGYSSEELAPKAVTSTPKQLTSPQKAPRKEKPKSKRETSPGKARGSKSKVETSMSRDSLEDISEKSEEQDITAKRGKGENIISIQDSSIDTSVSYEGVMANHSKEKPGFDTLDELDDKQKFFHNIENNADGTIDYGRLNQELSQTGTAMISPATRRALANVSGRASDSVGVVTPSQNHNLDITTDSSKQRPSMLSKVALLDSMDSTLNTTTSPKILNSKDTTQENLGATIPETLKTQGTSGLSGAIGTNTSKEMEDLQRVLQEAGMSPTIYGADSRPTTGKASDQMISVQQNKNDPVGDILRKIDAIERKGREIETKEERIQLRSDYQSPRTPRSPGLVRQAQLDDNLGGFDNSHTEDTEVYQPVTSVDTGDPPSIKERPKPTKRKDAKVVQRQVSEEKVHSARDRFAHVQSSGYGRSLSPPAARKQRSKSAGKSPLRQQSSLQASKGGKPSLKTTTVEYRQAPNSSLNADLDTSSQDVYLRQSIEAYARHLKDQFESQVKQSSDQMRSEWLQKPGHEREAALLEELKDLREQWSQERTEKTKLQADLLGQEKDFKRQLDAQKLKYEDETFTLKQENFVLVSKLKELEAANKDKASQSAEVSGESEAEKGRVARLERDIEEQEGLLAGYQAENKRLYEEMKTMQKQAKNTEGSMFKENQRLITELANMKQELDMKETELKNKGIITSVAVQQQIAAGNAEVALSVSRVAHLEGELAEAKRVQENQNHELKLMHQTKFELEKHIETLTNEKDSMARELAQSLKPDQVKELESRQKDEIEKIQRKLKWYTENQELLDKSSAKLRAKDDEIHRLKMRLEDFKSEAGRKLEENKLRMKEKAADNKKIQDLERQIKEMEQVIRRRHPNSLPAMMMVAATVPDAAVEETGSKGRSVQVLEARIKKLERELETKTELEHQDLRAMEQKYNQVKFHFEERIADLERQLAVYEGFSGEGVLQGRPHSNTMALQRELESIRERNKKQVVGMQAEVDRLTAELNKVLKNQENMMRNENRQTENDLKQQVSNLQKEVQGREHDIKLLQHTVDKMRSKSEISKKKNSGQKTGTTPTEWPPFPHAPSSSKHYQPDQFADGDMSSILNENQLLKTQLDQVRLERDQQRVELRKSLAETEAAARLNRERLENQIEEMHSNHQRDLQRMQADQALLSSSARVTELQNKCDAQEVMIRHLQAQLKKTSNEAERIPQMKNKETQLQATIDELQAKLRDAKSVHAPEMRHFESLENKLVDLVERQRRREVELDSMVKQNHSSSRFEMEEEVEKWKKVVENKNQQLQVFRAELDSILEILKTLQRQGVTLPVSAIYS